MTKDRDLKRRIRARMEKTGEAYTTARAYILRQRPLDLPTGYEDLAGHTDDALRDKTGRAWPDWVRELDAIGATELPHRDIARWVAERTESGWWAQTVAVGYERIRGLRAVGQRRDGGWEANRTRTVNVPMETLFAAFTEEPVRRRWLDTTLHIRGATFGKTVRIDWPDGSDVVAGFDARGPEKTTVSIQHGKLPSAETRDAMKTFWAERLTTLKEVMEGVAR